MKKYLLILTAMLTILNMAIAQSEISAEKNGTEISASKNDNIVVKSSITENLNKSKAGGILLIPESSNDRVMSLDATTGDVIDENFILDDDINDFFGTPIQAMQSLDKTKLYVSDQIKDVVVEFDADGNYIGTFAPAGGPNTSICDNIRGISYRHGTDHMLVSDGVHDAVLEFDGSGNYLGTFTTPGLTDPFDVVYWASNDQYLVNDIGQSGTADRVMVFDNTGNYLNDLATNFSFPEQIAIAPGGNILVAAFSSPSGIYEFQPDGTPVGYYDVIPSCRGVYELPNGNLLVTSGDGVYEISKSNTLVDTKYQASGNSFRFISYIAPAGVSVTFKVDMQQQTVAPEGVHIAGNFQGWNPDSIQMNNSGGAIYTYSQVFNAGDTLEYKYINGNDWPGAENVPAACAVNDNRFLIVPDIDTMLVAVCFGSCEPCGTLTDVTFQVDMSEQTVSPNGVHLAGSFQGWDPGATEMTDMGNGLYAVTVNISEGDYIEYKFINGNDWSGEEQVPPGCGVSNGVGGYNRFYDVPVGGAVLDDVCFSSCNPCGIVQFDEDVTFRVDMSEQTVSADGIHIAGDFQGWDPAATEMSDIGNSIYEVTVTLLSSDYHQYKFINGNTWDGVELVPMECGVDDGNGGYNRYLTVPEMDTTLADVCFSSCDPCGIIPDSVNVTFRVDMSEQTVSPDGIHVTGSFQGWDPGATGLNAIGNNVYEVELTLIQEDYYEYKFINGNTWDGAEAVPEDCGVDDGNGGFNRYLTAPTMDSTLMDVCFATCEPCDVGIASQQIRERNLTVYPNPFKNEIVVTFESANKGNCKILITDPYGRTVKTNFIDRHEGMNRVSISTDNLANGLYFLQLRSGSNGKTVTQTIKILKN